MKELIEAEDSDVYDVLRYVAYTSGAASRDKSAMDAKPKIATAFTDDKAQQFIKFILDKYTEDSLAELSPSKMRSLVNRSTAP